MGGMLNGFWDSPLVSGIAFQPRKATMGTGTQAGESDGEIACADGASAGYRVYAGLPAGSRRAVCVYFHGNAEICTDLSHGIERFYAAGLAVVSLDFRGYGWSKGRPTMGTLCPDAEKVHAALPALLAKAGLDGLPRILFGRSLGATCAVHLGTTQAASYAAVILESGLQTIKDLPMLAPLSMMIPNGQQMLQMVPEPLGTLDKMASLQLPLLIIHGEKDEIVPLAQAVAAHGRCPATDKTFERVAGAGHNDLLMHAAERYFKAVQVVVDKVASGGGGGGGGGAAAAAASMASEDVPGMSVKEIKAALTARSVDFSRCVEKSELVSLLQSQLQQGGSGGGGGTAPASAPAAAPAVAPAAAMPGNLGGIDLAGLMQNPEQLQALMQNPAVMQMAQQMMGGAGGDLGALMSMMGGGAPPGGGGSTGAQDVPESEEVD